MTTEGGLVTPFTMKVSVCLLVGKADPVRVSSLVVFEYVQVRDYCENPEIGLQLVVNDDVNSGGK